MHFVRPVDRVVRHDDSDIYRIQDPVGSQFFSRENVEHLQKQTSVPMSSRLSEIMSKYHGLMDTRMRSRTPIRFDDHEAIGRAVNELNDLVVQDVAQFEANRHMFQKRYYEFATEPVHVSAAPASANYRTKSARHADRQSF
jgi:predicted DNA binding CopG/RHH family protein